MRFRHRDGTVVHLAYCTNVHTAEDLAGVLDQLGRFAEPVREKLGTDLLGLGLWLARDVATALAAGTAAVRRLRAELAARGLEVVTLNGFPYQGFHAPVVKRAVYRPDWTEPARLAYTADLAQVLARLLPDDAAEGSVSSLPLAWRTPWEDEQRRRAREALGELAGRLVKIHAAEGRPVRVGFEPEPGCVVDTTADAVRELAGIDAEWLGVCLDACHLAVAFEEPAAALARLAAAGLPVVKTQASCALEAVRPADPETRAALETAAEPRFLHQVRERAPDGTVLAADDLDAALYGDAAGAALPAAGPWRVHFHAPVNAETLGPLRTTRPVLVETLRALLGGPRALTRHVEVETYTWSVLPDAARPATRDALVAGIAAELAWTRGQLLALGLEEVHP
ncbi:MAG TPA: metabolite traffic protein EboE [Streptosporangiaceae bacterium]|nr:metabolite traffic protein EboE [Streptosporangiaceae bacterium]